MQSQDTKIKLFFPLFLVLFEFTVYLANDMIMPGMVQVVKDFQVGNQFVPYSLTAFLLGGASLQIFLGPISDRLGRRKVMLGGVFFFLLSTVYILFSHSMGHFMLGRFMQGMGLCFIGTVGYASIQELYEEKRAVQVVSFMAMIAILAPLVGPLLGGIYTAFFHWRGVFVIISFCCLVSLVGLFYFMPETVDLTRKKQGPLVEAFENYSSILKNKKFLIGTFCLSFSNVPLLAWISTSPVILIDKAHFSSIQYGLCQIPIFGGICLGNFLVRYLVLRMELIKFVYFGAFFLNLGFLLNGFLPVFLGSSPFWLIFSLTFSSFGLGLQGASFIRLVLYSSSSPKGSVSAVLSLISNFVQMLATYAVAWVYRHESNVAFGVFCALSAFICLPLTWLFFRNDEFSFDFNIGEPE